MAQSILGLCVFHPLWLKPTFKCMELFEPKAIKITPNVDDRVDAPKLKQQKNCSFQFPDMVIVYNVIHNLNQDITYDDDDDDMIEAFHVCRQFVPPHPSQPKKRKDVVMKALPTNSCDHHLNLHLFFMQVLLLHIL